jgi:hypothetical protein
MNIMKRCAHDDLMHTDGAHQHDEAMMTCQKSSAPGRLLSVPIGITQAIKDCYVASTSAFHNAPKTCQNLARWQAERASLQLIEAPGGLVAEQGHRGSPIAVPPSVAEAVIFCICSDVLMDGLPGGYALSPSVEVARVPTGWLTPQRQLAISGMSSPCLQTYCLCSISFSCSACLK